ncbi:hypothetical protein F4677DRAFT_448644 [Hypoxylon crocopeplum]|nr:hypothetical protein F4677DRAFT_448644 [Hypoxylon crocopeplum]
MAKVEMNSSIALAGLSSARAYLFKQVRKPLRLKAEGLNVTFYERQDGPGGVWKFSQNAEDIFASPMYGSLMTNLPRDLMELSDSPWEDWAPVCPKHDIVQRYLQTYSTEVDVKYGTEVVKLFLRSPIQPNDWRLVARHVKSGEETTADFDYVIMATGTFEKLFMPTCAGLDEWARIYPNSISHSSTYRDASDFEGKASCFNVVVVGNSASGMDISSKLAPVAQKLWVASTRLADRSDEKAIPAKKIEYLVADKRLVKFEDNEEATDVDSIIFCTGYMYSSPFLKKGVQAQKPLFPDGFHVDDLGIRTHILDWVTNLGICWDSQGMRDVPRLTSPDFKDMKEWVETEKNKKGEKRHGELGGKISHFLKYPAYMKYIKRLEQWCLDSDEAATDKASEGNEPFKWTSRLSWVARNSRNIQMALRKQESDGQSLTTLESLGLSPPPKDRSNEKAEQREI